ncbi:hypothetical protein FB107DRAFT_276088 [Schizophyllum commune]
MPPTSDPQARLKTPPRHVLFHDRHFVANRRRALPDPQGLRRRVFVTKSGAQVRRHHSTFDARFVTGIFISLYGWALMTTLLCHERRSLAPAIVDSPLDHPTSSASRPIAPRALDIKTRFRLRDLPSTSKRTADAPLTSLRLDSVRLNLDPYATRSQTVSLRPPTSRRKIKCKTQHACLKRLVCLKIPWDRVNLTHFAGGGQLALESGSERESEA